MAASGASASAKPASKGQFAKRFAAWWDGRDYVPEEPAAPAKDELSPAPAPSGVELKTASSTAEPAHGPVSGGEPADGLDALIDDRKESPAAVREVMSRDLPPLYLAQAMPSAFAGNPRVAALEAIWGVGQFVPGDPRFDMELAEALDLIVATRKTVLTLGVNLPTLEAIADVTSARITALDWREPCVGQIQAGLGRLTNRIEVKLSDIERMNVGIPPEGGFAGLVSVDAFTYADYKPGLVSKAHRLLRPGAVWAVLDYVGEAELVPSGAFASAWAQPQLCGARTLPRLLTEGGFQVMSDDTATERLLGAAGRAIRGLPGRLDDFVAQAQGPAGALALRELAWELQSWRTRMRVLGTRGLQARLIIARRGPGA